MILIFSADLYSQNKSELSGFKWLTGVWQLESNKESTFEEWKYYSDTLLSGRSFSINKKDTIVNEIISIIKNYDGIFYKAEVFNQNNGQAVYFKLTKCLDKSLTFENKTHDFPKIIRYTLIDKKHLSAVIESDTIKYEFKMKKIK